MRNFEPKDSKAYTTKFDVFYTYFGGIFDFLVRHTSFFGSLLKRYLPATAVYQGVDLSPTMVKLAKERLSHYAERAQVPQSDGSVKFFLADHSVDRAISTYVLDLLSEMDIYNFVNEAHRVLGNGSRLCLVGLTNGTTPIPRLAATLWVAIFRFNAA